MTFSRLCFKWADLSEGTSLILPFGWEVGVYQSDGLMDWILTFSLLHLVDQSPKSLLVSFIYFFPDGDFKELNGPIVRDNAKSSAQS